MLLVAILATVIHRLVRMFDEAVQGREAALGIYTWRSVAEAPAVRIAGDGIPRVVAIHLWCARGCSHSGTPRDRPARLHLKAAEEVKEDDKDDDKKENIDVDASRAPSRARMSASPTPIAAPSADVPPARAELMRRARRLSRRRVRGGCSVGAGGGAGGQLRRVALDGARDLVARRLEEGPQVGAGVRDSPAAIATNSLTASMSRGTAQRDTRASSPPPPSSCRPPRRLLPPQVTYQLPYAARTTPPRFFATGSTSVSGARHRAST